MHNNPILNCGMRLSELNKINMEDISLDSKTVRLHGKGRKERIVDLNAACISALDQYIPTRKSIDNCDALFIQENIIVYRQEEYKR